MGVLCDVRKGLDSFRKKTQNMAKNAKAVVDEKIKGAEKAADAAVAKATSGLKKFKKSIKDSIKRKSDKEKVVAKNKKKRDANKASVKNHDTQDPKKDIKHIPMDSLNKGKEKYSKNVVPLKPASYSNSQDYPTKKGKIDEAKNFESHNQTTGEWWRAHHTGYQQKVDGKGNYEEMIPGTAKYYTVGDVVKSYESNVECIVNKNYFKHIYIDESRTVEGNQTIQVINNRLVETTMLDTEVIGMTKSIKAGMNITIDAGGNITIKAAGNIDIKAGGTINIKGAKVNIN